MHTPWIYGAILFLAVLSNDAFSRSLVDKTIDIAPIRPAPVDQQTKPSHAQTVNPRDRVTLRFRLTNRQEKAVELQVLPKLPPRWRSLLGRKRLNLKPHQSYTHFFQVLVPANAKAEEYTIALLAKRYKTEGVIASATQTLRVMPDVRLDLLPLEQHDWLIEGESFTAEYRVQNRGNTAVTFQYEWVLGAGWPRSLQGKESNEEQTGDALTGQMQLLSDEGVTLSTRLIAPPVSHKTQKKLGLRLTVLEPTWVPSVSTQVHDSSSHKNSWKRQKKKKAAYNGTFSEFMPLEVLPRRALKGKKYRYLPLTAEYQQRQQEANQVITKESQWRVRGGDFLDDNARHRLDVRWQSEPDIQQIGGQAPRQRGSDYWLQYTYHDRIKFQWGMASPQARLLNSSIPTGKGVEFQWQGRTIPWRYSLSYLRPLPLFSDINQWQLAQQLERIEPSLHGWRFRSTYHAQKINRDSLYPLGDHAASDSSAWTEPQRQTLAQWLEWRSKPFQVGALKGIGVDWDSGFSLQRRQQRAGQPRVFSGVLSTDSSTATSSVYSWGKAWRNRLGVDWRTGRNRTEISMQNHWLWGSFQVPRWLQSGLLSGEDSLNSIDSSSFDRFKQLAPVAKRDEWLFQYQWQDVTFSRRQQWLESVLSVPEHFFNPVPMSRNRLETVQWRLAYQTDEISANGYWNRSYRMDGGTGVSRDHQYGMGLNWKSDPNRAYRWSMENDIQWNRGRSVQNEQQGDAWQHRHRLQWTLPIASRWQARLRYEFQNFHEEESQRLFRELLMLSQTAALPQGNDSLLPSIDTRQEVTDPSLLPFIRQNDRDRQGHSMELHLQRKRPSGLQDTLTWRWQSQQDHQDTQWQPENFPSQPDEIPPPFLVDRSEVFSMTAQQKISWYRRWPSGRVWRLDWLKGRGDLQNQQFNLSVSTPFSLPLFKRQGITEVSGRIVDESTHQGIADIAVLLGDLISVTDSQGAFVFPSVRLGNKTLSIRTQGALLTQKIARQPLPMTVTVNKKTPPIQLSLVTPVKVHGRVMIASQSGFQKDHEVAMKPLAYRRVWFTRLSASSASPLNDSTPASFSTLTRDDGTFRMNRLQPGKWRVSVSVEDLPPHYRFAKPERDIDLSIGSETDAPAMEFVARYHQRKIRFRRAKS